MVAGPISAGSTNRIAATPPQATEPSSDQRNALYACRVAGTPQAGDWFKVQSGAAAQLQAPENRIAGQDWSGQDLSGRNFNGKVFVGVKFKGAKLRGIDLTDAIICGSDLDGADLSGARLDRALIGGDSSLRNADLSNASGHNLQIADADAYNIRIDGADLRDAGLFCDEFPECFGNGVSFASMKGADLRGATIESLLNAPPNLGSARLDRATTHLGSADNLDLSQLADAVGDSGHVTLIPWYGQAGKTAEFTGRELRRLALILPQMQYTSAHPSFDCARARSGVEKAICADPKLAALDSAMGWLWERIEHTPEQLAAQKAWIEKRTTCPPKDHTSSDSFSVRSFASPVDPKGCIGMAYAERIRQLAPKASVAVIESGTYTTDPPLKLPDDGNSALANKYLMARGSRQDQIAVEQLGGGTGKISGSGVWANGHQCSFESPEAQARRTGLTFRIEDQAPYARVRESVSFAVTPQVAIWAGGARQFQCGARGVWSDAYFRQPDDLVSRH